MVLVGGQALIFWHHKYRNTSYLEGCPDEPLASRDIDFNGTAEDAGKISKAIGGKVVVAAKQFDPNVTNAVVSFKDEDGDDHNIDFIKLPRGVLDTEKEFRDRAMPVDWDTHAILVMNPWQILKSRLANLEQLDTHKGEHSQAQARAAIGCMLAFTHEVIDLKGYREALKLIGKLKDYLFGSDTPKNVYHEFNIDARDAMLQPCEHLPPAYREKQYPISMQQIAKKWSI